MLKPLPSPDTLRKFLKYEPETGKLFWRRRELSEFKTVGSFKTWNARFSGKEAFTSSCSKGYRNGGILYRAYKAHRVIWAMVNDEWPMNQIDHINGITGDNRIINLRCVTNQENSRNQKIFKSNTSGFSGVSYHKRDGMWTARISNGKNRIHLGSFPDKRDAIAARKVAEVKFGFHKNHGRKPK